VQCSSVLVTAADTQAKVPLIAAIVFIIVVGIGFIDWGYFGSYVEAFHSYCFSLNFENIMKLAFDLFLFYYCF